MTRRRERGFALVAVLLVMVLLFGIGAVIHSGVIADTWLRGAHARATAGFYAAESGINRGMGNYRNIFLSRSVPSGADFDEQEFALGQRDVTYQLTSVPCLPIMTGCTQPANPPFCPCQRTLPAGRPFAGLNAIEYRYTAVGKSHLNDDEEANLGTEFDVDYVPLFQFLAFFQDDLEIIPGANMTLHGPIHTNGSLYLSTGGSATLRVEELPPTIPTVHITAAGDILRRRKNDSTCANTITIAKLSGTTPLTQQTMSCSGVKSASELATWLGSVRSRQPVLNVPTPSIFARNDGEYWTRAELRIVLDLRDSQEYGGGLHPIVVQGTDGTTDNALTAQLQNFINAKPGRIFYNDVPSVNTSVSSCGTGGSYCNRQSYTPQFVSNTLVYACTQSDLAFGYACPLGSNVTSANPRRGGFWNNRENAWVYLLNVNLHDLLVWNRAQGGPLFNANDASDGGVVIFLSVMGDGAADAIPNPYRYGVRVFDSRNLNFFPTPADPTGVTVVSDQAIYIEGDYNIDADAAGLVPGTTYGKQPAAFMGDTINVLSRYWSSAVSCNGTNAGKNDCQSRLPMSPARNVPLPAPANSPSTIINAAFIGGMDLTVGSQYNGGLENYPRLHEGWTGNTPLVIRGSFVELGEPVFNTGVWVYGSPYYTAPRRDWDYDPSFQDVRWLPPLDPRAVSVQQIIFTENFR